MKPSLSQKPWKIHLAVLLVGLIADQLTKFWAVAKFSLESGAINYYKIQPVISDILQFRLVYNSGAAFGMQPQKIAPFLHPTLFYGIISLIAIVALTIFYLRLPGNDKGTQLGVACIASGAFGNLADRFRIHKVVDFIDVDIPDINIGSLQMERWPTFNIADSMVCVGVALIFLVSFLQKKSEPQKTESTSTES